MILCFHKHNHNAYILIHSPMTAEFKMLTFKCRAHSTMCCLAGVPFFFSWTEYKYSCKCGDCGKAMDNCSKGCRYCLFSCALENVAVCDGCYNCFKTICKACDTGISGHKDLMENTQLLHGKVKDCLKLETGN